MEKNYWVTFKKRNRLEKMVFGLTKAEAYEYLSKYKEVIIGKEDVVDNLVNTWKVTDYAECEKCQYHECDVFGVRCNRAPWDRKRYGCPKDCRLEIPTEELEVLEGDVREWCKLNQKEFYLGYVLNGAYVD